MLHAAIWKKTCGHSWPLSSSPFVQGFLFTAFSVVWFSVVRLFLQVRLVSWFSWPVTIVITRLVSCLWQACIRLPSILLLVSVVAPAFVFAWFVWLSFRPEGFLFSLGLVVSARSATTVAWVLHRLCLPLLRQDPRHPVLPRRPLFAHLVSWCCMGGLAAGVHPDVRMTCAFGHNT